MSNASSASESIKIIDGWYGEPSENHASGVLSILKLLHLDEATLTAAHNIARTHGKESLTKLIGDESARLLIGYRGLRQAQAKLVRNDGGLSISGQEEMLRKMLLAFGDDLRVVLIYLASRLQTLRWITHEKIELPKAWAQEILNIDASLANRLGIWQMKWEMEDLAFRVMSPDIYRDIAKMLDAKRIERQSFIDRIVLQLQDELKAAQIDGEVLGRPKHIYSIWKKMQGKSLDFADLYDVRAFRVLVADVKSCYAVLGIVHNVWQPVPREFDDYIARPKSNGYQSLHTVVRDAQERPIEIQIRTREMHEHAEHGVAAHWAYKEAGAKGYSGVSASGAYDAKIAVLRQLLAWERDLAAGESEVVSSRATTDTLSDRIYVLTPDAAVVELPQGATAVDFAYTLHTNLGHRCRGARVDGAMVPLNTPLKNGQTVEITAVKEGGPSRDWLNAELGFLVSSRARSKVRAWFNAQAMQETAARGREAVEKLLQREGKTAIKLDDLASQLGFKSAEALFEVVGKDEFSLRNIETLLNPPTTVMVADDYVRLKKAKPNDKASKSGVLVVGIDSLLTQLSKCCKPAPPDEIRGFVTRGKGVSIHRADCGNFRQMALRNGDRVIEVDWGQSASAQALVYPVDVNIEALDRQGLLRDISEVFAKEKMNVIGVQTQSVKDLAWMTFTVEVGDSSRLAKVLGSVREVKGVRSARRR